MHGQVWVAGGHQLRGPAGSATPGRRAIGEPVPKNFGERFFGGVVAPGMRSISRLLQPSNKKRNDPRRGQRSAHGTEPHRNSRDGAAQLVFGCCLCSALSVRNRA